MAAQPGTVHHLRVFHWRTEENSLPCRSHAADQALNDGHLFSNETARLLRAFLRFELYCKLFPGCGRRPTDETEDGYIIAVGPQNDYFLVHLRPLEKEELACVEWFYDEIADILSKGTDFLYDLTKADEGIHRKLIIDNVSVLRIFLPKALVSGSNTSIDPHNREESHRENFEDGDDDPSTDSTGIPPGFSSPVPPALIRGSCR